MKYGWHLQRMFGIGLAPGLAVLEVLEGSGLPIAEQLAREVIQNSCDAAREFTPQAGSGPVRVVFRFRRLEGEERERFLDLLDLGSSSELRTRISHLGPNGLGLRAGNVLQNPNRPVSVLYIEDFGTRGLRGDPSDPDSDVHRLMFSIGSTDKDLAEKTGGSYGFGKSVLARASWLNLVLAYTLCEDGGTLVERLIGAAYLKSHEYCGEKWTGWAWFGPEAPSGAAYPCWIEGHSAHQLARALGFTPRSTEEPDTSVGTSLLLPNLVLDVTPDKLKSGVEQWWWPRLEDGELRVEIVDEDGRRFEPEPRSHPTTRFFIECYRLATGRAEPSNEYQSVKRLDQQRGCQLGTLAMQRISFEEDADERQIDTKGTIALIRSARMVVEYFKPRQRLDTSVVGVFVAHDEIDRILKLSEPPNHDRWDPNSQRLHPDEGTIVRTVLRRIKEQYRDFAETTPRRLEGNRRLEEMSKMFGRLFSVRRGIPETGRSIADPIHIRFVDGPSAVQTSDERQLTRAEVELQLDESAPLAQARARFEARAAIVEVGSKAERESIDTEIACFEQNVDGTNRVELVLSRDHAVRVHLESAQYDADWSLELSIRVEVFDAPQ